MRRDSARCPACRQGERVLARPLTRRCTSFCHTPGGRTDDVLKAPVKHAVLFSIAQISNFVTRKFLLAGAWPGVLKCAADKIAKCERGTELWTDLTVRKEYIRRGKKSSRRYRHVQLIAVRTAPRLLQHRPSASCEPNGLPFGALLRQSVQPPSWDKGQRGHRESCICVITC
eukprot:364938-Chlamydomonas_euryale.AAC.5